MSTRKTVAVCLAILLAGAAVVAVVFSTEPTAKREGATKQTPMLVEVTTAERGTFRPVIVATGTVEPSQDIVLSPRVGGEVVWRAEAFTPGGIVEQGDLLLRIDPADYENRLAQLRSDLHGAEADLNIEMGRQYVARQDYQLLDDQMQAEDEALVLREPQLKAARARVEAARAAVAQGELDLQRTAIRAPFDAHVLSRNANVGSQVAPGDDLGRLVGRETYWVATTVPLGKLRWLAFPDPAGAAGSPVHVRNPSAWGPDRQRTGRLHRLVGTLEERTRMARVLVEVDDPLARGAAAGQAPLMIGTFVEVSIEGREIPDVLRLDRRWLRQDDTVWVMAGDTLSIREVAIAVRDGQYAYITDGLGERDSVVTTNLATVAEGVRLRLARADTAGSPPPEAAAR